MLSWTNEKSLNLWGKGGKVLNYWVAFVWGEKFGWLRTPFNILLTAVKRPRRFSFYLVGFHLIFSGNMGKDV